jgi:hypothetical protein
MSELRVDKLFAAYLKKTKPSFDIFTGTDRCVFLTGGMAIKLTSKLYREKQPVRIKLPTRDFDFKWCKSSRPTKRDYALMCSYMKSIVRDFIKKTWPNGGVKMIFKKTTFSQPVLTNAYTHKFMHGIIEISIQIGNGVKHDLVDATLIHLPHVSDTVLDKATSHKYGVPIPKLSVMFIDTITLVKKTLAAGPNSRNAWRNPIKSSNPNKEKANMYRTKGLKDVDRLLVMKGMLKAKKYQNLMSDVSSLKNIITSKSRTVTKLKLGKILANGMDAKIKNVV